MTQAALWFAALLLGGGLVIAAARRLSPRQAGAVAVMAGAAGLLALRQFALAVPLAMIGYTLWSRATPRQTPSPGQVSEVSSAGLRMRLDHETGEMDGEALHGPFAGRRLSELDGDDLRALLQLLEAEGDAEGVSLLSAFLQRRGDSAAPPPDDEARPAEGGMSREEAYRVLGLQPGAGPEEIQAAHKRLIRKVHPDLGGSDALAAMINAAKHTLDPDP